jgi:hypothetical protein
VPIEVCPACGYPVLGFDLCSACRPAPALTGNRLVERQVSATKVAPRAAALRPHEKEVSR